MPSIFISYRRGPTEDITYRIYEKLKERFEDVFIDIDNIPPGVRFPDHLASVLASCDVVLAIIGPDWLTPRLNDPGDLLRQEIELALEQELTVIPVLVRNGNVPQLEQVPPSLQGLLEIQAMTVASGKDFSVHTRQLIEGIEMSRNRAAVARQQRPVGALPEALEAAARSPIEGIRLGAIDELGRVAPADHSGAALALLEELRGDASPRVAAFANAELRRLTNPPAPLTDVSVPPVRPTSPETVSSGAPVTGEVIDESFSDESTFGKRTARALWTQPWFAAVAATLAVVLIVAVSSTARRTDPRAAQQATVMPMPTATQERKAVPDPPPTTDLPTPPPSVNPEPQVPDTPSAESTAKATPVATPATRKATAPKVRMGQTTVSGRLAPEVIQRIVRQNYGRFRLCYEQALASNPKLEGRVQVRFVIGRDGSVSNVSNAGSDIPDSAVVQCVLRNYYGLSFPQPEGGIVTVVYPIMFSPG